MNLDIIKNARSLSIVGNAASILSSQNGANIDASDVVIRMNAGFPKCQVAQGSRTDFLVFSTYEMYVQSKYKMPTNRCAHISIQGRPISEKAGILNFYPLEMRNAIAEKLGASPSVGISTIDWISSFYDGQVNVFGFDFKKTHSFHSRFQHIGHHNYKNEKEYIQSLCKWKGWNTDACKIGW
jgi:hypothetical protein